MAITGLAIQGDSASCGRVTRFYLHYSLDGKRFETYVDPVYNEVSTKLQMYRLSMITSHAQPRLHVSFENLQHLRVIFYVMFFPCQFAVLGICSGQNFQFAFSMRSLVVKFASLMSVCIMAIVHR